MLHLMPIAGRREGDGSWLSQKVAQERIPASVANGATLAGIVFWEYFIR
jgi:hypothetical protein